MVNNETGIYGYCHIIADGQYQTFISEHIHNTPIENELVTKTFPSGASWAKYKGARSLKVIPLSEMTSYYAVSYTIVFGHPDLPLLTWILICSSSLIAGYLLDQDGWLPKLFDDYLYHFHAKFPSPFNSHLEQHLKETQVIWNSHNTFSVLPQRPKRLTHEYQNPHQWCAVEKQIAYLTQKMIREHPRQLIPSICTLAIREEENIDVYYIAQISHPATLQKKPILKSNTFNLKTLILYVVILFLAIFQQLIIVLALVLLK